MSNQCQQDCKARGEMHSHQIKVLNERVDKFESLPLQHERMNTMMEIQMETMKGVQESIKDLNTTLTHVNTSYLIMGENMNNMSKTVDQVSERVEKIEEKNAKKPEGNKDNGFLQQHYLKIITLLIVIIGGLLGIKLPL